MTVTNGPHPTGNPDASSAVAGSLSMIGYAMFAWLQPGPLESIPSLSEFAAGNRALSTPSTFGEYSVTDDGDEYDDEGTFGDIDVDDNLNAIMPAAPAGSGEGTTQPQVASVMVTLGPDGLPVRDQNAPADDPATNTPPPPPLEPVGEYTGNETLAMLKEISFLDE